MFSNNSIKHVFYCIISKRYRYIIDYSQETIKIYLFINLVHRSYHIPRLKKVNHNNAQWKVSKDDKVHKVYILPGYICLVLCLWFLHRVYDIHIHTRQSLGMLVLLYEDILEGLYRFYSQWEIPVII